MMRGLSLAVLLVSSATGFKFKPDNDTSPFTVRTARFNPHLTLLTFYSQKYPRPMILRNPKLWAAPTMSALS